MTFVIVLSTLNLHIEMFTYCTSYTNNRTCQIAYKYTGIKTRYKIDKLASKTNMVRGKVLTFKSGLHFKKLTNADLDEPQDILMLLQHDICWFFLISCFKVALTVRSYRDCHWFSVFGNGTLLIF